MQWIAVLPPGSPFLVMQRQGMDVYLFAGLDDVTPAAALATMQAPIDLGNGIVLASEGTVHVADSVLTGRYNAVGTPNPVTGYIKTLLSKGSAAFFIGLSAPDGMAVAEAAVEAVSNSLRVEAPARAASGGAWVAELDGYKLSRFFTRTGYTEEEYIWLCEGGQFYRSFNSGGFGGGASGAFQSKDGGRWAVSGSLVQGALTLTYNDGSYAEYVLTMDDGKLHLDGKRWFREANMCY